MYRRNRWENLFAAVHSYGAVRGDSAAALHGIQLGPRRRAAAPAPAGTHPYVAPFSRSPSSLPPPPHSAHRPRRAACVWRTAAPFASRPAAAARSLARSRARAPRRASAGTANRARALAAPPRARRARARARAWVNPPVLAPTRSPARARARSRARGGTAPARQLGERAGGATRSARAWPRVGAAGRRRAQQPGGGGRRQLRAPAGAARAPMPAGRRGGGCRSPSLPPPLHSLLARSTRARARARSACSGLKN